MSRSEPASVSTTGVKQPWDDRVRVVLEPGTRVEVRTGFDRTWARGFVVVDWTGGGYTIQRLSDGRHLPAVFSPDRIRRERREDNVWWI